MWVTNSQFHDVSIEFYHLPSTKSVTPYLTIIHRRNGTGVENQYSDVGKMGWCETINPNDKLQNFSIKTDSIQSTSQGVRKDIYDIL